MREHLLDNPSLFCGSVFFEKDLVHLLRRNDSRYDLVAVLRVMQQIGILERQNGRERGGWRVRTITVPEQKQIVEAAQSDELLMVNLVTERGVDPARRRVCVVAMRAALESLAKLQRARPFVRGFFDSALIIPATMRWRVHEQRLRATLEYARFARIVFPRNITESMVERRHRIADAVDEGDHSAAREAVRHCWAPLLSSTSELAHNTSLMDSDNCEQVARAARSIVALCWPMTERVLCNDSVRPDPKMVGYLTEMMPEVQECLAQLALSRPVVSSLGPGRVSFHDVAVPVLVTVIAQLAQARWLNPAPLFDCLNISLSPHERDTLDRFAQIPPPPKSDSDRAVLSRVRRKLTPAPSALRSLLETQLPQMRNQAAKNSPLP